MQKRILETYNRVVLDRQRNCSPPFYFFPYGKDVVILACRALLVNSRWFVAAFVPADKYDGRARKMWQEGWRAFDSMLRLDLVFCGQTRDKQRHTVMALHSCQPAYDEVRFEGAMNSGRSLDLMIDSIKHFVDNL